MIIKEMIITQHAANFAARFGFINLNLFCKYFCTNAKTQRYYYWGRLVKNGYFMKSQSNESVYFLTLKGKRFAQFSPVAARSIYLIPHDLIVAKLLLEIQSSGFVVDSWTEAELMASKSTVYSVLGVDRVDKLPDLVLDLKANGKTLRCAFEVENSRKIKERYDRMAMSYLAMKKINLIIFGCDSALISRSIRRSFSGEIFIKNQKIPITFQNSHFEKDSIEVEAELLDKKMKFKDMILAALELNESAWTNQPEKARTQFGEIPEKSSDKKSEILKQDQDVKSARPSPGPLASFRDHPLPTNTLREGGHEPGAGVGRGPENTEEDNII